MPAFAITIWLRGTGWAWRSGVTGTFFITNTAANTFFPPRLASCLKHPKQLRAKDYFPFSPSPNDVVYDYTASGVRRSIEDSLQRLGIDSIDIAFVHDISPDNKYLPTPGRNSLRSHRKAHFLN